MKLKIKFKLVEIQTGKWAVSVRHPVHGMLCVFRYVYENQEQAQTVAGNLQNGFGQPSGVDQDIACNYWTLPGGLASLRNYDLIQRTTQKTSWYLCPKLECKKESRLTRRRIEL